MIDHGTDDPLIPVEGTLEYYNRLRQTFGGIDAVKEFCQLYLNPGDGHAGCTWHGPGLMESVGMRALIDWVEHSLIPQKLRGVQTDSATGKLVSEQELEPM